MGEIADILNRAEEHGETTRRRPSAAPLPRPGPRNACLATPRPIPDRSTKQVRVSEEPALRSADQTPPSQFHSIPSDRRVGWQRRVCAVDPESPTAVRFRHLAIKIRTMLEGGRRSSVLVTSALAGEGKTTVSINLALALASIAPDARIALVDLDLRKGNVSRALEFQASVGIESVLRGERDLDSVCVATDLASLDFYPVFNVGTNTHGLLGSSVESVLQALSTRYDFVVCDGPPGLLVPDVSLIAPHVGGCLAVSRSRLTRHSTFKELLALLPPTSLLGVFLNDCILPNGGDKYRYYDSAAGAENAAGGNNPTDLESAREAERDLSEDHES